jgi:hypothetical protein
MHPFRYSNWLGRGILVLSVAAAGTLGLVQEAFSQSNPTGYDRAAGLPDESGMDAVWETQGVRGGPIEGNWSEGFDDITSLPGDGWVTQNNSEPTGSTTWFQGNPSVFPSLSGGSDYIGANFNNTSGVGIISNWLMTPEIALQNGTTVTFWTRTGTGSQFPDRLQVRFSQQGSSTDVGSGAFTFGDFEELLVDINEELTQGGYPDDWEEYNLEISGLSAPQTGRIAFRYFVSESAGPSGDNSNYVGIDNFSITQPATSTDGGATATGFALEQNHPNPISTSTVIQYTLADAAPVRIEVYDVLGRLVSTLIDSDMPAGTHTATWHVNGVASGVYLYRIQAGEFTQTRRALVSR